VEALTGVRVEDLAKRVPKLQGERNDDRPSH
jgi:hypothetical protein